MLQAFHYFFFTDDSFHGDKPLWEFISEEADHWREIGIDSVWIPPMYKNTGADGEGRDSIGYDVYDHFDLGEFPQRAENVAGSARTKYGTLEQLQTAIDALHGVTRDAGGNKISTGKRSIQAYGDIVINHKAGGASTEFWQAVRVDKRTFEERFDTGPESGIITVRSFSVFDHSVRKTAFSSRGEELKPGEGLPALLSWGSRHFDAVDAVAEIRQNGVSFTRADGSFVTHEDEGNKYLYRFLFNGKDITVPPDKQEKEFDFLTRQLGRNQDYLLHSDLDYGRLDVREEMKTWGEWVTRKIDLDGFRLDAIKHISSAYIREWIGHVRAKLGKNLFVVGELLDENSTAPLHEYITEITARGEFPQSGFTLFDFPLLKKFRTISQDGDQVDLRSLDEGTLMAEQPALAITFVDNHDKQFGREFKSHVENWFKPLAYAYILLRQPGYPCIFFPDYYGSQEKIYDQGKDNEQKHDPQPNGIAYLQLLLALRKQFALGEERYYDSPDVIGWVRLGGVPGAKGAMAVTFSTANNAVRSIRMNTGRFNRRFYLFAVIKFTGQGYLITQFRYERFGERAEDVFTNEFGEADFLVEGGTVAIWIEDGVGLNPMPKLRR